ncbi:MAG: hypothetical protein M3Y73_07760 [Actinomycetota bacterium]|nr:hypothetical protein [Actinomycetota bacterium]
MQVELDTGAAARRLRNQISELSGHPGPSGRCSPPRAARSGTSRAFGCGPGRWNCSTAEAWPGVDLPGPPEPARGRPRTGA